MDEDENVPYNPSASSEDYSDPEFDESPRQLQQHANHVALVEDTGESSTNRYAARDVGPSEMLFSRSVPIDIPNTATAVMKRIEMAASPPGGYDRVAAMPPHTLAATSGFDMYNYPDARPGSYRRVSGL